MPLTDQRHRRIWQLVAFLCVFFVLWTFRATHLFAIDETITDPISRAAYSNVLKVVLWVLPSAGFGYWLRHQSPAKYLALSPAPRFGTWLQCASAIAAFVFAIAAYELFVGSKRFAFASLLAQPFALLLLQLVVSPFLEELLFRGFLMKELLAVTSVQVSSIATSLLFVAVHLPFWLSRRGPPLETVASSALGVFLFSILACWLFAKSASVWPPTVAHFVNNVLSAILQGSRA